MRPVEPADAPTLAAWSAHTGAWCGFDVDLTRWLASPSGGGAHAWIGPDAAIRVIPQDRLRRRHLATVELASGGAAADALDTAITFADRWSPVDRLELALPEDHPALRTAEARGFVAEARRRGRLPDGRDEIALGRLRPGFVPRPPGAAPPWPPRGSPGPAAYRFTPPAADEDAAIAALSTEPWSLWGTLQIPSSSVAFYADRRERTPPGAQAWTMWDGDTAIGSGGLFPSGPPGVAMLGMMIGTAAQGRGAGRALLAHLLAAARASGLRRVELGVYVDNDRAVALYRSAGFLEEGARRCDAIRDGGQASTLEMALTPG